MDVFELRPGEKIRWKAETDGKTYWRAWPVVDDGDPRTDDELTGRTYAYRNSLGIRRANPRSGRFDVERRSEAALDAWFRARGLGLTFASVAGNS